MKKLQLIALGFALCCGFVLQQVNAQDSSEEVFKPSLKIEGRIMFDFNFLSAGDLYNLAGNEFRRVRLAAKGKAAKNLSYIADFEFAGGSVNFRNIYLKYHFPDNIGTLTLGNFTEPTSLSHMTSSKYITFFERPMMVNTQPHKYNAGFMYDNQKLFDGRVGLQLAYTFNGYNNAKTNFTDDSLKGGANFIARLTSSVLNDKEKHQVVHLGVNYEHRDNDSDIYGYKFRFENHMGEKFAVSNDGGIVSGTFKNTSDIGFELATTFGPLSIQGEYEASSIITDVDTYKTKGYYGFVSFFVTGEHRPYKNSTFGRVKLKKELNFKKRTFGALELVARYSVMDFSNYPGVYGTNKIANISAGFNWYLNKYARIMYNYTNANFNDLKIYDDEKLTGHLIRFQVDF